MFYTKHFLNYQNRPNLIFKGAFFIKNISAMKDSRDIEVSSTAILVSKR